MFPTSPHTTRYVDNRPGRTMSLRANANQQTPGRSSNRPASVCDLHGKLLELPPRCLENIGNYLSTSFGKNYKDLASMIGYTHHELEVLEMSSKNNPGYKLLKDWSVRKGATTSLLRQYLEKMERYDIIDLLDSAKNDPTYLTIVVKDKNGKETYRAMVETEGSMTINELLESRHDLKSTLDGLQCSFDLMNQQASIFKGRELIFSPPEGQSTDDEYLTTALVGHDADEIIDGYHPDAVTTEKVLELLTSFKYNDGTYIIRPSRQDPSNRCISVVSQQGIMNYKIWRKDSSFYLFVKGPTFPSFSNLVAYYKQHPLCGEDETGGPILIRPVTLELLSKIS